VSLSSLATYVLVGVVDLELENPTAQRVVSVTPHSLVKRIEKSRSLMQVQERTCQEREREGEEKERAC